MDELFQSSMDQSKEFQLRHTELLRPKTSYLLQLDLFNIGWVVAVNSAEYFYLALAGKRVLCAALPVAGEANFGPMRFQYTLRLSGACGGMYGHNGAALADLPGKMLRACRLYPVARKGTFKRRL